MTRIPLTALILGLTAPAAWAQDVILPPCGSLLANCVDADGIVYDGDGLVVVAGTTADDDITLSPTISGETDEVTTVGDGEDDNQGDFVEGEVAQPDP